jgi:hypothetical protein
VALRDNVSDGTSALAFVLQGGLDYLNGIPHNLLTGSSQMACMPEHHFSHILPECTALLVLYS